MKREVKIGALIALGLLFIFLIWQREDPSKQIIQKRKYSIQETTEKLKTVEATYKNRINVYEKQIDSLQKKINKAEKKYAASKNQKLAVKKQLIKQLKPIVLDSLPIHTVTNIVDSLQMTATRYIQVTDSNESNCDSVIKDLKQLIAIKDGELVQRDSSYQSLKMITENCLQRENEFIKEYEQLSQKKRRAQLREKILAGALTIVSAIGFGLFINK